MANLSEASGTLKFINFEECPEFLKEFKGLIIDYFSPEETQYFIDIDSEENEEISEDLIEEFTATGRWTFGNSLENFFHDLSVNINLEYIHEEHSQKIINDKLNYILDMFKKYDLSLEFDFVDFEPSNDIFMEGNVDIKPIEIKEEKGYERDYLILDFQDFSDYTDLNINMENLIETNICSKDDFILPNEFNTIEENWLPEPYVLDLDDDSEITDIIKELSRQYVMEDKIFCIRENILIPIKD
ncbi:hypothetical protein CPT_Machias_220 [Staphylococcus phage Machias]|nr:hypothetical protein CPT_Machias_220 [Staphylococcus phage Machias]